MIVSKFSSFMKVWTTWNLSNMRKLGGLRHNMTQFLRNWSSQSFSEYIVVSEEVKESLKCGLPVVALESTIITHGMPYPDNLRTALSIEDIVRKNNAIPATIAVLKGKAFIGLNESNLQLLASKQDNPLKLSKRDLPYALAEGMSGGTTVASTMALAYAAGIKVFVTGGIGGVHRNGETTMDISADLMELSRIPMTVVSAGVKSILDIGRTLEFLETHSVCVATYGSTNDFPAFFAPKSGFKSPSIVRSAEEAAKLISVRDDLGISSGVLIAVPIPDAQASESSDIENSIEQAILEANSQKVSGKEVTPFVLQRVQQLSKGAALRANIALIENNARVGSSIAVELCKIHQNKTRSRPIKGKSRRNHSENSPNNNNNNNRPVVIGGSALDFNITCFHPDITMDGSTLIGKVETSPGGVGRNLADGLFRLDSNPFFISVVGSDDNGNILLSKISHMDTSGIQVIPGKRTCTFSVLLNASGECVCVVGDMTIYDQISTQQIDRYIDVLSRAPLVVVDSNLSMETMNYVFRFCSENRIPVWVEPTDVSKAVKSVQCEFWKDLIVYTSPNLNELRTMHDGMGCEPVQCRAGISTLEECVRLGSGLLKVNPKCTVVATLGPLGALLLTKQPSNALFYTAQGLKSWKYTELPERSLHFLPPKPESIVSVSGAGDCFASGMIAAIVSGFDQEFCIRAGQEAAKLSLASIHTVPDTINRNNVFNHLEEPDSLRIN